MTSGKYVNGKIFDVNLTKIVQGNGFIPILNINIYSNLSKINKWDYLKFWIPILHRHFLRIKSQNPKDVKTYCNDRTNLFHFACQKRISENSS